MNNYTLEDIGNFIEDYKASLGACPNDFTMNIPIISNKKYERFLLEQQKREVFEKAYIKAMSANSSEQENFINQMAPILDDFYSKKKAKH